MSPAFRLHVPTRHLLQSVVTNRRGGAESLFKVSMLDQVPSLLGMIAPHAGIAIGLKLHTNRQGIAFGFRRLSLETVHFFRDAEQVLHMVADLVRNHIGLGKVPGGSKAMLHFIEEPQI